jgi:large subunit ribosomal protein L25
MSDLFEFEAVVRDKSGTSVAKAIRHDDGVPAIIYGAGKSPEMLVLEHNKVVKSLSHEAVFSHVLDVKIDGKSQKAILKAVQRHPSKPRVLHIDFQRISQTEKLRVNVPLHFINEESAAGVKEGGIVTHNMVDIEVSCLPKHLPEFIEIDLIDLELGASIHLTEIELPEGVESTILTQTGDHDLPVVAIVAKRVAEEEIEVDEVQADEAPADDESGDE